MLRLQDHRARHRVRREGVGHAERGDRTGGFTALNVKSGKCVLQFELDPKFRDFIPKLVEFTGQMLNIHVYDDQEVMFVDRDTGEVAYEDAPLPLPGVAGE